ncbi:hypothetical protein TNCT_234871 [Trichonephila clavata]|uniref:Uncharacterized protein n=1 Tax=Trichonephila clavata TaxID=2740835 RepID=A0A8X6GPA0_TRICU|nr:hypothetical protein TNCT_234871 [Trichonephila clavata]
MWYGPSAYLTISSYSYVENSEMHQGLVILLLTEMTLCMLLNFVVPQLQQRGVFSSTMFIKSRAPPNIGNNSMCCISNSYIAESSNLNLCEFGCGDF